MPESVGGLRQPRYLPATIRRLRFEVLRRLADSKLV